MNFETFRWPKPIDSSDSENSEELLEREKADEIMEQQEMAEMEKTAELVAEQEKKEEEGGRHKLKSDKKIYPKSQTHMYRAKETGIKINRKPAEKIVPVDGGMENPAKLNPEKSGDDEVNHPYEDIYPNSRNLNRR